MKPNFVVLFVAFFLGAVCGCDKRIHAQADKPPNTAPATQPFPITPEQVPHGFTVGEDGTITLTAGGVVEPVSWTTDLDPSYVSPPGEETRTVRTFSGPTPVGKSVEFKVNVTALAAANVGGEKLTSVLQPAFTCRPAEGHRDVTSDGKVKDQFIGWEMALDKSFKYEGSPKGTRTISLDLSDIMMPGDNVYFSKGQNGEKSSMYAIEKQHYAPILLREPDDNWVLDGAGNHTWVFIFNRQPAPPPPPPHDPNDPPRPPIELPRETHQLQGIGYVVQ